MSDIVFIVEEYDKDGNIITLADKYYNNFPAINKDVYFNWTKDSYIRNTGLKIKYQTYSSIENFDPNKRYFYFIPLAIWTNDFHNWFMFMEKEKVKRLADNNVGIIFAYDNEHLPSFDVGYFLKSFEWFVNLLNNNGDNRLKFYFLSVSNLMDDFKTYMSHFVSPNIKFIYSPLMFASVRNTIPREKDNVNIKLNLNLCSQVLKDYCNSPKNKQFLNLNNMQRYHRDMFINGLRAFNLLDQGYVSRNMECGNNYPVSDIYKSEYADKIRQDRLSPLPIMRLDATDQSHSTELGYHQFAVQYMKDSCYDIVSETGVMYELGDAVDMSILSEKTAKSLAFGRPFMINGGPNCMKIIKKLGFQTFEWLFDESYDSNLNLFDRQELLIKNILRYKDNIENLWKIIIDHKDILEYNQNKFFNFDFERYIVGELFNE